jgi:hypothetical protein
VLNRHLRSSDHEGARFCVQKAFTQWQHKHFYCFESLAIVAEHIGFRDVEPCEYGKREYPQLVRESRFDQVDVNLVVELTR